METAERRIARDGGDSGGFVYEKVAFVTRTRDGSRHVLSAGGLLSSLLWLFQPGESLGECLCNNRSLGDQTSR